MGQFIVNFKSKQDLINSNQQSSNTQKKSVANVIKKTKRQVKTV